MEGLILITLIIVVIVLGIISVISGIIDIILFFSYIKYNKIQNSSNKTGVEVAKEILQYKNINDIQVKTGGSFIFGNSYSHYFKKIRLRRLTRNKTSLTSIAMGSQKASLAILDKENDKDMIRRIKITPFCFFGTLAFIPLVVIGFVLDLIFFKADGIVALVVTLIGLIFYILAILLSFSTLKSEKKAQHLACDLLKELNLANENEIIEIKNLFKLYNIQYINDIIISILQLIKEILKILLKITQIFQKNKH